MGADIRCARCGLANQEPTRNAASDASVGMLATEAKRFRSGAISAAQEGVSQAANGSDARMRALGCREERAVCGVERA